MSHSKTEVWKTYGDFISRTFDLLRKLAIQECSGILYPAIGYQLDAMAESSKGMRPALVAAAAAIRRHPSSGESCPWSDPELLERAAAIQALHEATLIIDDILDDSPMRRGRQSLRAKFDPIIAACAAAELETLAGLLLDSDRDMRRRIRSFKRAVCVAETMQIRGCPRPTPILEWNLIAEGDTGAIISLAFAAGGVEAECSKLLKGMAYLRHGLDDVDDLLDENGDQADVLDAIPTLPTCFTSSPILSDLRAACVPALDWLRPWLDSYRLTGPGVPGLPSYDRWEQPMKPFFDDFATAWKSLRIAAETFATPREIADDVA